MSKAILVRQNGGPDVMQLEERTLAALKPDEVQVRHEAIGLNFVDTYYRSGLYKAPLPAVLGQEGAGIIVNVGADVTTHKVGDRVSYYGPMGSYAEERNMPSAMALHVPEAVDMQTAAAITLKGFTAYYLLKMTHQLKAGETILIHAAAGGVGQILVQWAKHIGATIIATVGTDEKAEMVRALGADHVINMRKEDFAARVKDITADKGVDVVYDSIGKDTFTQSLSCLRMRGLMVSFGNASGPVSIPDLGVLTTKGLFLTRPSIFPYFHEAQTIQTAAQELFDLVSKGVLSIKIGQTFALKDAAKAHTALETRQTIGATVLIP